MDYYFTGIAPIEAYIQDAGQKQMVRSRDLSTGNSGNMSPCNMVLVGRDGIEI